MTNEKLDNVARSETARELSPEGRRRLTNALLGKSLAELLFVIGLSVTLHYVLFNPYFRGWTEMNGQRISGWAVDEAEPRRRVEVQLYVDGLFVADQIADDPRPDVAAAGRAPDEWSGFNFDLPTLVAGEHEARVYVVHESGGGLRRTLQQLGRPLRFRTGAEGEVSLTSAGEGEGKP